MSNKIGIKILHILKKMQRPLDVEEIYQNLAKTLDVSTKPEFKNEVLETLQLGVDLGFIHVEDGKYLVKPYIPKPRNQSIHKRGDGEGDGYGGAACA